MFAPVGRWIDAGHAPAGLPAEVSAPAEAAGRACSPRPAAHADPAAQQQHDLPQTRGEERHTASRPHPHKALTQSLVITAVRHQIAHCRPEFVSARPVHAPRAGLLVGGQERERGVNGLLGPHRVGLVPASGRIQVGGVHHTPQVRDRPRTLFVRGTPLVTRVPAALELQRPQFHPIIGRVAAPRSGPVRTVTELPPYSAIVATAASSSDRRPRGPRGDVDDVHVRLRTDVRGQRGQVCPRWLVARGEVSSHAEK